MKEIYGVITLIRGQSGLSWDSQQGAAIDVSSEPVWTNFVTVSQTPAHSFILYLPA